MSLFEHLDVDKNNKQKNSKPRLKFVELCNQYEVLVSTRSTLQKEAVLADFILYCYNKKKYPSNDFKCIYQLTAKDFVHLSIDEETGVSIGIFIQTLADILKKTKDEVKFLNHGDWGETVAKLWESSNKKGGKVTANDVIELIYLLPRLSGKGSQNKKITAIKRVLLKTSRVEAKYLARLLIGGSLKIGVQEKLIQKAYFTAFTPLIQFMDKINYSMKVRQLNFGYAVVWYLDGKLEDKLNELRMKPGHPVKLMLAERGSLDKIKTEIHFVEEKYDGYRVQAHLSNNKIWMFSRQLTDQTNNLMDIVKKLNSSCKVNSAIFDGELLAYNKKNNTVLPFQSIIRRKRKHDTREIASQMHTEYRIFDLLFVEGKDITSKPLHKRRKLLESALEENDSIKLSEVMKTNIPEEALDYAQRAKSKGHEGVMIKPHMSIYHIGKRDKDWIKIKPDIYDLDGILVGGQYGTGKRKDLISRIYVAFPNSNNKEYYDCLGVAVGSGLSEEEMMYYKKILEENGSELPSRSLRFNEATVKPDIWLDPERNIIVEILADSFSWKTKNNEPMALVNIPKLEKNGVPVVDLTKISLRFPRFKKGRELGKEPNNIHDIETMIILSFKQ